MNTTALRHRFSLMTKALLVQSDMKQDVEAVALRTLLSANGVLTATLPAASATNGSSQTPSSCSNQPLHVFVTARPEVQRFLKQVDEAISDRFGLN
jgi:hypothetical protein